MKKIFKTAFVLVGLLHGFSDTCIAQSASNRLAQFEWLVGSWENKAKDELYLENWHVVDDSTMEGDAKTMIKGELKFRESISITATSKGIFYSAITSSENGPDSTAFRLIENQNQKFVFENKEHDFPQRIIYEAKGRKRLMARIEGEINGAFGYEDFPMKKVRVKRIMYNPIN